MNSNLYDLQLILYSALSCRNEVLALYLYFFMVFLLAFMGSFTEVYKTKATPSRELQH